MDPLHITEFASPRYFNKLRSLNEAADNANTQNLAKPIEGPSQPSTSTLQIENQHPLLQRRRRSDNNATPGDQKRKTLDLDLTDRNQRQSNFGFRSIRSKILGTPKISSTYVDQDGYEHEEGSARLSLPLSMLLGLPNELQLQIIASLPVPTILNLRLVSKLLHLWITQNEFSIARFHLIHSVPAYAIRLYPEPDLSKVNLYYLCGLWHRLHVAQKLSILISENITREIFLRDTEAKWIEFLPCLVRMRQKLMPLIFTIFHFFEKYRDLHLQHLKTYKVPLRLQPFTLNPIEKQVIDMYDNNLLLSVHQVFPLIFSSFSRRLRPPSYTGWLEHSIKGQLKDKPANEVYATIFLIGGLQQVERFWEPEGYITRRTAVDRWYRLVTDDPVQISSQRSKFSPKLITIGRKKGTLSKNPIPIDSMGGANHKAESYREYYNAKQISVGSHQTANSPIYDTSMAAGPPMKLLPQDQLKLLLSDQQPWTSIWLQTAEAVILERKIVKNSSEIKRNTQVLLELIREDGPTVEEAWAPGSTQASRHNLHINDTNAFRSIHEQETTAFPEPETTVRNEMVEESQSLPPPSITVNANVVEHAQNVRVTTIPTQLPVTADRDAVYGSEPLQNINVATEAEITTTTRNTVHFEHTVETNIPREVGMAPATDTAGGFKNVDERLPQEEGEIVRNMEKPVIQKETSGADSAPREVLVKAPMNPQNSNLVPLQGKNNSGEFIVIILICYGYMVIRIITIALLAVQRLAGEPDIPQGKERVRWQCSCGYSMYDDFVEQQQGAAKRLERSLNHNYESGRTRDYSTKVTMISLTTLGKAFSKLIQSTRRVIGISSEELGLPQQEMQSSPGDQRPEEEDLTPPDTLWLLLCHSEGVYATKLLHLKVCKYDSDQKLFAALRTEYTSLRGRWLSFISFRTLTRIKFVQFEMYEGRPEGQLVDVRKADDIPPFWNSDYRYNPTPAELIPPVGDNHLMHLFQHPLHAQSRRVCFDRFPKKLRDRLVCAGQPTQLGWGLHFVEGWSMKKIWLSGFLVSGFGSLVFGILWAVFAHSIQDAFAVAGYCLTVGTFGVGTVQAILHLN